MISDTKRIVIIHYGEIALKGKNRPYFEKRLRDNIKKALRGINFGEIKRLRGRMVIYLPDEAKQNLIEPLLKKVFGISYFSFGVLVDRDIEVFKKTAWQLLKNKEFNSFRIEARRAEKGYELNSMQINQAVGAYVQEKCRKKVDLTHPEATCFIEIAGLDAFIYSAKIPGLRGLPVGVSERAVSLLSSGIDSPVASYMMLKRGVNLIYAHFHSQPFTNQASTENTERLVEILSQYQRRSKVYFVPFIEIQKEIMAKAPEKLRVLLYRRYMVRIAGRIADLEGAVALVTGESVGQVASQTLSNIRVVAEVTSLPILRPLSGFDKEEIIQTAKKIETFETSIQPYEDCCSLFIPENVATKGKPRDLFKAEKLLELDDLITEVLEQAEIKIIEAAI